MQTRFLEENAYLKDMLHRAERAPDVIYSRFMDHSLALYAQNFWRNAGCFVRLLDVYAQPDRLLCALSFYEEDMEAPSWPLAYLLIEAGKPLKHPHVLGSVTGLGIKRDYLGDIFSLPDGAVLISHLQVAGYIENNLTQVGADRVHVKCLETLPEDMLPRAQETTLQVASLRLDCLLESALKCSRSHAQELIRQGQVKRNWEECLKADKLLAQGDVLSVRNFGRIVFMEQTGVSKKGRLYIRVALYHT